MSELRDHILVELVITTSKLRVFWELQINFTVDSVAIKTHKTAQSKMSRVVTSELRHGVNAADQLMQKCLSWTINLLKIADECGSVHLYI